MNEREQEANPYRSPHAEPMVRPPVARKRRSRWLWLVIPTVIGMVTGVAIVPSDYFGYPPHMSLGGAVGLACGMLLRLLSPSWERPMPEE